jgi:3-hydroxyacyl-[acyl-carrier-protein] dehydratase
MNTPKAATPHGPGFRFIDHFEQAPEGPRGTADFHLHPDLWFFRDHFPGNPLMPAALLLESAAQAAGILWMSLSGPATGMPTTPLFVAGVDSLRVLGPAYPGDTLRSSVELLKELGTLAQFQVETATGAGVIFRSRLTLSRELKG